MEPIRREVASSRGGADRNWLHGLQEDDCGPVASSRGGADRNARDEPKALRRQSPPRAEARIETLPPDTASPAMARSPPRAEARIETRPRRTAMNVTDGRLLARRRGSKHASPGEIGMVAASPPRAEARIETTSRAWISPTRSRRLLARRRGSKHRRPRRHVRPAVVASSRGGADRNSRHATRTTQAAPVASSRGGADRNIQVTVAWGFGPRSPPRAEARIETGSARYPRDEISGRLLVRRRGSKQQERVMWIVAWLAVASPRGGCRPVPLSAPLPSWSPPVRRR